MNDFILSSSGLSAYRRCPKSYQLGYEMNLEAQDVPGYVTQGSSFHAIAANYAKALRDPQVVLEPVDEDEPMLATFAAWLQHYGAAEFEAMAEILHVEDPIYTRLTSYLAPTYARYGSVTDIRYDSVTVWLRTTFDLVYRAADGWIVIRDYKTFEKMPTLDASLDFQSRIYIAATMKKYKTNKVRFEHVYVRRDLYHTGKQSDVRWTPDESYIYDDIIIDQREAGVVWREAVATATAICETRERHNPAFWWRTDIKGTTPFTCARCFMKKACVAELEQGALDPNLLSLLGYGVREPLTLPKELVTP